MSTILFETLAHLPVNAIVDDVARACVVDGKVAIVTSEVASGKTLLIPATCAALLAEHLDSDPVVYVLEPTRFLANNAAETLRSILGKEGENLVGCINANRSDDESITHPDNQIVFTTVGYALSSGIVTECQNIILDEAHETSLDMSLAKACLHHRRLRGEKVNVAVLSATLDLASEQRYWGEEHCVHFTTAGSAFPVEFLHRPSWDLGEAVCSLIENHDRKGILVFVSGLEEIGAAEKAIAEKLASAEIDYEIATIHGNSTGEARRYASQDPAMPIKILIGTNVMESGVSLPWVDAGVSSGDTKVMHVTGNIRKLIKEPLPAWRIQQQMGRVARFTDGVFILAHEQPWDSRPNMALPDIVRLPLTELVMRSTSFPDIPIRELQFTDREQPKRGAIATAIETLVAYELIEVCDDGRISLTPDGRLIQPLPLSYKATAAVCEAVALNALSTMLPLIAMLDIGDIRQDYRDTLSGASWSTSDLVYQTMVFAKYFNNRPYHQQRANTEFYNVNLKKHREYTLLLHDLENKTNTKANFIPYHDFESLSPALQTEFDRVVKQVIFRANILEAYPTSLFGVRIPTTISDGEVFASANFSRTTTVFSDHNDKTLFCSGTVRVITPKADKGRPFAVMEQITLFTRSDLDYLTERFGRGVLGRIIAIGSYGRDLSEWYRDNQAPVPSLLGDPYDYVEGDRVTNERPQITAPETKTTGSFGDLLSAALSKKE